MLKIKDSYLAVVNSHFAAHQNMVKERNADYARVVTTISDRLRDEVEGLESRAAKKKKSVRSCINDERDVISAQEQYRQEQERLAQANKPQDSLSAGH